MRDEFFIDAEFEVIDDGRPFLPPPPYRWSFWRDDFPNLAGMAAGFAMLALLRLYFAH